jgi:hypothetical protein
MKILATSDLTEDQKAILRKNGEEFKVWRTSQKGIEESKVHRDHEKYFHQKLSAENLDRMTANEFAEIYKKLWASNMWGNKDWYIQNKLIASNGFEKIRAELKKLLYGKGSISERYNELKSNIKGFGSSSLSEILHFVFPDRYCLWNDKPKTVLPALDLHVLPDRYFKYQIHTGEEYSECIRVLELIKHELSEFGIKDFIDLDLMFWHIFDDILPRFPKKTGVPVASEVPSKITIDTHESAEYYLLELGRMLGYYTYTVDRSKKFNDYVLGEVAVLKEIPSFTGERDLNSARQIDVIWFGDDEDPKMCFEVEHTTDITHGLNRLAQLKHLYLDFFIVSSEDRRNKFEIEMNKFPYRTKSMRERYHFISYDELTKFFEMTIPFYRMKTKLFGEV